MAKKQKNIKLDSQLYDAFLKITEAKSTTPTKVLDDYIKDYVLANLDVLTATTTVKSDV